jgi:hypothetical protein
MHTLKRPRFLHDLFTERRIQIVSPSEDVAAAYLRKSTNHLASAILLNDNGHYEEAVSIAYYSMYHAVMALFFSNRDQVREPFGGNHTRKRNLWD